MTTHTQSAPAHAAKSDQSGDVHSAFLDDKIELPNLPEVAWKVREAIEDPDISVDKIAQIVQNDPAIAARLVQVANSPLYCGLTKVENLRMVIGRLGLNATQSLVTLLAVKQLFRAKTALIKTRFKVLYEHSTSVAALCTAVADRLPGLDRERACLCGLLHDIGVIPILTRADKQPDFFTTPEQLEQTIVELRTHTGSWVLQQWSFDGEMLEIVREARNWNRDMIGKADYCDVVNCALLLKQAMDGDSDNVVDIHDIPLGSKLAESGLVIVSYKDFIDEAKDIIDSIRGSLN
ncbi:MAG: HDOD domain-containing protein [Pseudomonadota bacterium]